MLSFIPCLIDFYDRKRMKNPAIQPPRIKHEPMKPAASSTSVVNTNESTAA